MRPRRAVVVVVSATALALTLGACRGTAENHRREAAKATAEAEDEAAQATITSASLESREEAANEAIDESDRALREEGAALAALEREENDARADCRQAIDAIDRKLSGARSIMLDTKASPPDKNAAAVRSRELQERRDALLRDMAAIDRVSLDDWATLKSRIDRDLEPRPPPATPHEGP